MQNKLNIGNILWNITVCVLFLAVGFIVGRQTSSHNKSIILQDTIISEKIDTNNVIYYLQKHKVRFSHIVLAQSLLESNNYKSKLTKTNNNIFGMKVPAQRFTFAENHHDFGNYSKYENIESCILDYKSWQMQNAYNITSEEGYFNLLSKIYAEDKEYVQKLKKLIK